MELPKKQYHIGLCGKDGARYALLPGDPGRVAQIAAHLDAPVLVANHREYTTYAGGLMGERVLVTSTGIGGPSAAIALEELYKIGVRTCIRVGTCGGMQQDIFGGDLVIASGAVRAEGTSKEYVPVEYPAVADFDVTRYLASSAKNLGFRYHVGVVHSKDSFYGQHAPSSMPAADKLQAKWEAWIRCGCLASEMEAAALFIAGSARRMQIGCILTALWNQERENASIDQGREIDSKNAIWVALDALRQMMGHNNL